MGNVSVYNNVNNPRQSVYLKYFCTTSHHHDMHVHVKVSMTRFRDDITEKKIDFFLQTDLY